jgi:predicted lysophospholipase L1 biosynthesis ABC-type transport system permease subunit
VALRIRLKKKVKRDFLALSNMIIKLEIERMKKYLTIIMAITLLITGTGVGFCKESKKTEM